MKNYFEIFNLPVEFDLDQNLVESKHLELQNKTHPDANDLDQIELSIAVNDAYKTLSDDFLRACYILSLNNINILKDEKSVNVDKATLIEILELQEIISESNAENLSKLKSEIKSDITSLIKLTSNLINQNSYLEAAQILVKVKYLKKSLEDIKSRQKDL